MSSWRKTDDKDGIVVTLWRPLTDEDGVPLDEDRDEREREREGAPQWCMATGCLQPLGSRYYEVRTIGHDRAACGHPGPGGPRSGQEHTWPIRRVYVCTACYTTGLEREVGAGWTRTGERAGGPSKHARRTGRRQGDWDD